MEKEQYPYVCHSKGHVGDATFYAAPPSWWESKGRSTPRNCKVCRDWIKEQKDTLARCSKCGQPIRISALKKISIHKRVSPYQDPTECEDCESGNQPPVGTTRMKRRERKRDREEENPDLFSDLTLVKPAISRNLALGGAYYETPSRRRVGKVTLQENREIHLLHHVPGSKYDLTQHSASRKTPTSFTKGTTLDELLSDVQYYVRLTDAHSVREYTSGSKVYRVTFAGDHDNLEFTILEETGQSGQYGVVTTYDNVTAEYIKSQEWYHER